MEESEDNLSSEDLKYDDGTINVKAKSKKRSLVERELETNLTARVTSPITYQAATSTSRYGRARRLKTETDCDTEKSVVKSTVSPRVDKSPSKIQSAAYKMHASNSPIRVETPKRLEQTLDNQIENIYSENISLSRFGSEEKSCKSSSKKYPKVYIRKDLIQSKDKDSDETVVLIKNMFSPSNSSKLNSYESSEMYNTKKPNGHINSVVKTLDFDGSKKKKSVERKSGLSKSDLFEMEAKCEYQVGDLAWARMGTYPFWPCIITRDPLSEMFVKKKLFGRIERDVLHVTFFGDNGRRGWIVDNMLRKFLGQLEFEVTRMNFTPEAKKKDPKLCAAFFISEKKMPLWQISVEEAETLLREPKRLRIDILNDMLEKSRVVKTTPQHEKSKKVTRTNSDVSLSESLYDTLFSSDDSKTKVSERSRSKSRNRSLNVSEVVTACLDNMAAKTGITKIQRQSHMDRWLQKAKSKTPEKSHAKSQNSSKVSTSAKSKKKFAQETQSKMQQYKKHSQESQSEIERKLQSHQNEHDYSILTINTPILLDDVEIEYENAEILTTDLNEPGSGIGIISKVETLCDKDKDKNRDTLTVINDEVITSEANNIGSEICIQINDQLPTSELSNKKKLEYSKDKLDTNIEPQSPSTDTESQSQTEEALENELECMEVDEESDEVINENTSESAISSYNVSESNKNVIASRNFDDDDESRDLLNTDVDQESMDVSDLHTEIESNNVNDIFNNDFEFTNTICIPSSDNNINKTTITSNEESSKNLPNIILEEINEKVYQYKEKNKQVTNKDIEDDSDEFSTSSSVAGSIIYNIDNNSLEKTQTVEIDSTSVDNNIRYKKSGQNYVLNNINNKKSDEEGCNNRVDNEDSESVASELSNVNNEEITENGLSEEDDLPIDSEEKALNSSCFNKKSKLTKKIKLSLNKSTKTVISSGVSMTANPETNNEFSNLSKASIENDNPEDSIKLNKNIKNKEQTSTPELIMIEDIIVTKNDFMESTSVEKHSIDVIKENSKISDNNTIIVLDDEVENIICTSTVNSSNFMEERFQMKSSHALLNGYHEANTSDNVDLNNSERLQNEPAIENIHPKEQKSKENDETISKRRENVSDDLKVIEKQDVTKDETEQDGMSVKSEDSELSIGRKKRAKDKQDKRNMFDDPDFLKYLELRQDAIMDEHPELSQTDITNYLYKTWLYEENLKTDTVKADDIDHVNLVKGLNQDNVVVKKIRKKIKIDKEKEKETNLDTEGNIQKEKSKRRIIRPYYKEDFSDTEEDIEHFKIFKMKPKVPNPDETLKDSNKNEDYDSEIVSEVPIEYDVEMEQNEIDLVEEYFRQLTAVKPNLFKGLIREKVCDICERVGNLVKCKVCHNMFHVDCDRKQTEVIEVSIPVRGRKKKKKNRGRKAKEDGNSLDSESQSDEKSQDANVSEEIQNTSIDDEESHIIANADEFEAQLSEKMKDMLENPDNFEYDSCSNDELDWNDTDVGVCKVVDIKPHVRDSEESLNYSDFKCNNCQKYDTPVCFVCKSAISPKDKADHRQRCQVAHCQKYYHMECLDHWPQTQFNAGELSRTNKSNEFCEALSCPRHVCHTCVCDDPRGCKTRFSGDKLARCVRCPATYHTFTKCLPAGTQILSGSHIICPRHYEHRPGKVPCHVNTGWCFICALGGSLICCEYCPTSFHAECLNIKPPEGGYMCEDCETGRLPLYGEMVWVKLGHYRWWPGIILHPSEIPHNILAVKHSPGEFVVRFFGQYDHYWVNRGRVFPFQEGDSGKVSSQKSKIDAAFSMAMEHAQRACEILKTASPNEEESIDIASSLLPPHYVKLRVNKPCGSLCGKRIDIEESSLTQCECNPDDLEPCGLYTQCLNRMLLTECGPTCRAGDRCNNRAFEKRLYPKMVPYRTPHRGWGLKTLVDIKAGQFVIEYVGELIDEDEFQRRMRRKHEVRDQNFYFLTLDKERMIDAGPKGNLARFMNHSCEPNCETQKWTVLGDIRVGLFAIYDIPANSELTFNYNLESTGIEKKQCMCGAKRCSGYIGAKPKQDDQQKKLKLATKRTYKKRKAIEDSPSTSCNKPKNRVGRPYKPRELTEIEKDLLIIKNATNGMSSDSECSGRVSSIDSAKDSKALKRKRTNLSTEEALLLSPSTKRLKSDNLKSTEVE